MKPAPISALAALLTLSLSGTPAVAGKVEHLLPQMRCIDTIRSGDALLGGIHTGSLPGHVFFQRCDTLWMVYKVKRGAPSLTPIGGRFIPKFRAKRKPFAIPDARVTVGARNIQEAWLTRPTRRYDHAILGDDIEAGGLAAKDARGRKVELILPEREVFEDRMARLVDLDGDGNDEMVVVRTRREKGASLAVYAVRGARESERIMLLAESAPIGRPHRWLNPAAAADFDGDGRMEIAWVETPHIGGTLKVARLEGNGDNRTLVPVAKLAGFSNHRAGSGELQEAVTFDWDGDGRPDIILPDAERKRLQVVALKGGRLKVIDSMEIGGEIDSPILAADLDGDGRGEVLLVTKDARLLSFRPE